MHAMQGMYFTAFQNVYRPVVCWFIALCSLQHL